MWGAAILMPEILLIDDDDKQLRLREAVLRESGFKVRTASTPDQAFASLRDPKFAASLGLIITDHVMPGAGGATFVRELRKLSPQVPVLVVSGMAEAEDEYSALGVSFLNKPCRPEDLIRRVQRELDRKL